MTEASLATQVLVHFWFGKWGLQKFGQVGLQPSFGFKNGGVQKLDAPKHYPGCKTKMLWILCSSFDGAVMACWATFLVLATGNKNGGAAPKKRWAD